MISYDIVDNDISHCICACKYGKRKLGPCICFSDSKLFIKSNNSICNQMRLKLFLKAS